MYIYILTKHIDTCIRHILNNMHAKFGCDRTILKTEIIVHKL